MIKILTTAEHNQARADLATLTAMGSAWNSEIILR